MLFCCIMYFCLFVFVIFCSSPYFRVQIKGYKPSLLSAWCIQHNDIEKMVFLLWFGYAWCILVEEMISGGCHNARGRVRSRKSNLTYCSHKPECIVTTNPDRSALITIITWHFQFHLVNISIVTMHEGACEAGSQIWRTVRTSPSALWQQTPTDRP